jgi:PIN domain nuclease of toxin-antitoxin system
MILLDTHAWLWWVHECPLITSDSKIISYPHVMTIN